MKELSLILLMLSYHQLILFTVLTQLTKMPKNKKIIIYYNRKKLANNNHIIEQLQLKLEGIKFLIQRELWLGKFIISKCARFFH